MGLKLRRKFWTRAINLGVLDLQTAYRLIGVDEFN